GRQEMPAQRHRRGRDRDEARQRDRERPQREGPKARPPGQEAEPVEAMAHATREVRQHPVILTAIMMNCPERPCSTNMREEIMRRALRAARAVTGARDRMHPVLRAARWASLIVLASAMGPYTGCYGGAQWGPTAPPRLEEPV